MTTLTAVITAYNEEESLGDTIESLMGQTEPADRLMVVDDGSTDGTREVALSYGVECVTCETNQGSKSKALNYVLHDIDTDLVFPADADTLLAPDYFERIKKPFADPEVSIAGGYVQTRFTNSVAEKGRSMEYVSGQHLRKPIQMGLNSPIVSPGCNSALRVSYLKNAGGIPSRTLVEDMDYTWTEQIAGRKAAYVTDAVAYTIDPPDFQMLGKQLKRWMGGFLQCAKVNFKDLWQKPALAVWVLVGVADMIIAPLFLVAPIAMILLMLNGLMAFSSGPGITIITITSMQFLFTVGPLVYGCLKRGIPLRRIILWIPQMFANQLFCFYCSGRAVINELVLVPLGFTKGLTVWEKGH